MYKALLVALTSRSSFLDFFVSRRIARLLFLSAGVFCMLGVAAVQAGNPLWTDPEMNRNVKFEYLTHFDTSPDEIETFNSSILLVSGRYVFHEALRAVVDVPVVFMKQQESSIVIVMGPNGPMPVVLQDKTEMLLGNARLGLEFGELENFRTTIGVGLPLFDGNDLFFLSRSFWIDGMRGHFAQPETLQFDGHIIFWLLRKEKRDFQLRTGLRAWFDTDRSQGIFASFLDIEGLFRMKVGPLHILAGPSVAIALQSEDSISQTSIDDVLGLNLGTSYKSKFVPLELGLMLNFQLSNAKSTPSSFLGIQLAYTAD